MERNFYRLLQSTAESSHTWRRDRTTARALLFIGEGRMYLSIDAVVADMNVRTSAQAKAVACFSATRCGATPAAGTAPC